MKWTLESDGGFCFTLNNDHIHVDAYDRDYTMEEWEELVETINEFDAYLKGEMK